MKRTLLILAALSASAAEAPEPESLLPEDALFCLKVDSVGDLKAALAASPIYAGALDGSWGMNASAALAATGVDPDPKRTVLWDVLEALEPHAEGPAAAALTTEGPVLLIRTKDEGALKQARALGIRAEMDGAFLRLSRRKMAPISKPLSESALYRKARAAAPGPLFLYVNPEAFARSGRLGARLSGEKAPFAEALAWSSTFGKDGVSDTLRLFRPYRPRLFPAAAAPRLASALPPLAAARVSGRVSLKRLRECLTGLTGKDWLAEAPIPEGAGDWTGEFAASFGWALIFPDLLVGLEAADPKAAADRIVREAQARGAKVLEGASGRTLSLPDQSLSWTVAPGDRAVWIGTNPGSVASAAQAAPKDGKPEGIRASLKLPEAFGPAAAMAAGMNPQAAKLLNAKARFELTIDEDEEGLILRARSPSGLLPALCLSALGLQALDAHAVVEGPREALGPARRALPGVRGLAFEEEVKTEVVSPAETRALFEKAFDKELPPEKMAKMEETMRAFGLLEPDQSLRTILTGALVDLVGGFYDPDVKTLYLIEGMPMQRIVAAHELTHALQDQHFRIGDMQKALQKAPADADRDAALLALIEGDASVAMMEVFQGEAQANPAMALRALLEVLASPGMALGQLGAMQDMPDALLYQTMFSYEEGAEFVRVTRTRKGWPGVDAMFKDPPVSTEQILHPEKYLAAERDLPKKVEAPKAPEGWTVLDEDTMGELGIRAYLRHFVENAEADRAGAGWGGDRFALFAKGKERLLLWKTVWDSKEEALEFSKALIRAQEKRYGKESKRARVSVMDTAVELRDGPEAAPSP